jgi:hypothetical protein
MLHSPQRIRYRTFDHPEQPITEDAKPALHDRWVLRPERDVEEQLDQSELIAGFLSRSARARVVAIVISGKRSNALSKNVSAETASIPYGRSEALGKSLRLLVTICSTPPIIAAATTCRSFSSGRDNPEIRCSKPVMDASGNASSIFCKRASIFSGNFPCRTRLSFASLKIASDHFTAKRSCSRRSMIAAQTGRAWTIFASRRTVKSTLYS